MVWTVFTQLSVLFLILLLPDWALYPSEIWILFRIGFSLPDWLLFALIICLKAYTALASVPPDGQLAAIPGDIVGLWYTTHITFRFKEKKM